MKKRADELLVEKKLIETRSRAAAFILAGSVEYYDAQKKLWFKVDKAGHAFQEETDFRIDDPALKDVGRGAQKLRGALKNWPEIKVNGERGLDAGSSTGGFTQVLLEHGAESVVALDVGTHQLHERLRNDARVISIEKQHVLKMSTEKWQELRSQPPFGIIVTDLSFISLPKIIPTVAGWLRAGHSWILLVKPQFELTPEKVPKGIVHHDKFHQEAIQNVRDCVEKDSTLIWKDCIQSPILGGDGNKEFLLWLEKK